MRLVSLFQSAAQAAFALALIGASAHAQTIGCEVGVANGGTIPASGSGGGSYPGTLPTAPSIFPLTVAALPPGATVVTEVKLFGLAHTWSSDAQLVLEDPAGGLHNLFVRPGTATGTGYSCDYGGDYTIVPPCTAATLALPTSCTGVAVLTPGLYDQYFGRASLAWPSGTNGIANTPLDSIAAATGTWNLRAYDWASGDTGSLVSWDLCFGTPVVPTPPTSAPTLTSPADLAVVTNPVTLTWSSVTCATSYDVDIDGSVTTGVLGTSFIAPPQGSGFHTWTVRAANAGGTGPFAASRMFEIPAPPPTSVCVSGGGGGLVPATGTGGTGATWPTTLPATPFENSYLVNVPTGASQIVKVELNGATHTWLGDMQAVLTDPTGGQHNLIHRVGFTGAGFGLNCDLSGDYSIYESAGASWPAPCPGSGVVAPGDYDQNFSNWTSGDLGIFNTPLSAIPVASGMWTLTIYDWGSGDAGALTSWRLCFDDNGGLPTFCVPQTPGTINGCIPTMNATVNPDVAHSSGTMLTVSNVEGDRQGLLMYGINGQINVPWCAGGNSFRCVLNPVQRMGVQNSGGTAGSCDGSLVQDWDAYQIGHPASLGSPFTAGDVVDVQGWFRDPGSCKNSFMSQGVRLTYQP